MPTMSFQRHIDWLEISINELLLTTGYGDAGLIFHIREGKIEWVEKIKRETEKAVDKKK